MRQLSTVQTAVVIASLSLSLFCSTTSAQTSAPIAKKGIVVQGGREAIGPKQDDPRATTDNDCTGAPIAQDGKPGTNDPAAKKQGIIVQGGLEAIGPKQDDPRSAARGTTSMRAIGPKQDDPRAATGCQRKKPKA